MSNTFHIWCEHCNTELGVSSSWEHYTLCPICKAIGHEVNSAKCDICLKEFSDKIKAISESIDARVLAEGLICVDTKGFAFLKVGKHYNVHSLGRKGTGFNLHHWVRVLNDINHISEYPASCFLSVSQYKESRKNVNVNVDVDGTTSESKDGSSVLRSDRDREGPNDNSDQ